MKMAANDKKKCCLGRTQLGLGARKNSPVNARKPRYGAKEASFGEIRRWNQVSERKTSKLKMQEEDVVQINCVLLICKKPQQQEQPDRHAVKFFRPAARVEGPYFWRDFFRKN
ncbi:hypothetical protein QG37_06598 [Candidozyma auris]|uniref:Uncharacterized protein n=1 Tax=Candidozyma auris TaxID=498019 RepID=A0A0L0NSS7_CANAR|nr:hypothetical protein QG37_06598 [[Candida] auris]